MAKPTKLDESLAPDIDGMTESLRLAKIKSLEAALFKTVCDYDSFKEANKALIAAQEHFTQVVSEIVKYRDNLAVELAIAKGELNDNT